MNIIKSPLAGWVGGKRQLSKHIIPLIPSHEGYAEPFAGAAWVLFRKNPSSVEVLNDLNRDIVTLYRVLQHHLEEFIRYFRWVLVSRDEFERLLLVAPDTLTDIQRASRFYYLQKLSFGGHVVGPTFGVSAPKPPRLNLLRIEEDLSAAHLRLARVIVEHLPYSDFIARYDRPATFFYLDPPYWGCEDYYGKALFNRDDFQQLADQLSYIQGKFILSLNDVPEIRAIFKRFEIREVSCTYSLSRSGQKRAGEVLIANFEMT